MSQALAYNALRYDLYKIFAHLCYAPISSDTLDLLKKLDVSQVKLTQDHNEYEIIRAFKTWQETLKQNVYTQENLADEFQNVFIGIGRGEVMPYASWHLTGNLMGEPLIKVRSYLQQLGLRAQENYKEPEDHISFLCQVMLFLFDKNKLQEQQEFFKLYFKPWYNKFLEQLNKAPSADFYRHMTLFFRVFFLQEEIVYL